MTPRSLLIAFALLPACFDARRGGAGPDGGGSAGDGPSIDAPVGDTTITRARVLMGGDDDELRVATGPGQPLAIAAAYHLGATWRDPAGLFGDLALLPEGNAGAYEIAVSVLDDDLSTTWITPIYGDGVGVDLEDLAVGTSGDLVLVLGEVDAPGVLAVGVGPEHSESCAGAFLAALHVEDGSFAWLDCAPEGVKAQRIAAQDDAIASVGSLPNDPNGEDAFLLTAGIDGEPLAGAVTTGGVGDDELGVVAASNGGFVAGGVITSDGSGVDGVLVALDADLQAGEPILLGTAATSSADSIEAIAASAGRVWVAGKIGGALAWPLGGASTGYTGTAFVAGAEPNVAEPQQLATFEAADEGELRVRALDFGGALTIAGDCQGTVRDDAGVDHVCGTAAWPFFARLNGSTLAVERWTTLTETPGTKGQVSKVARRGGLVYMAGDWQGSLVLPVAELTSTDQDAFLIEVSGL